MNYLLTPNMATRSMFKREFEVMERTDILKIGIQVRFGDQHISQPDIFDTEDAVVSTTEKYFEVCLCADAALCARLAAACTAVVHFCH